jgi:hypothetical protein
MNSDRQRGKGSGLCVNRVSRQRREGEATAREGKDRPG